MATSCQKDDDATPKTDPNKPVATTDANALSQVLVFPNAKLVNDATLPVSSPTSEAPAVVNYDKSISYSSGSKIILPTDVEAKANIKGVYIQIKGASTYYDVPIASGTSNATVAIPFNLPSTISNGTFVLLLKFYDINGKISAVYEVTITVTKPDNCGITKVSGGQGLTSNLFKLPNTAGKIKISYETFVVKDKIDVFQSGVWIGGTGPQTDRSLIRKALNCSVATEAKGYVGQKAEFLFDYNPALGTEVEVVVSGCEDGGTKWEYIFSCPGATASAAVPELTTTVITSITSTGAISGGNISDDKGAAITARGVVWSTSASPTTALTTKTSDGNGKGLFTSTIAGLTANTKYYIRAYATNSAGTAYGNEVSFNATPSAAVAQLTTTSITSTTATGAISGGNITDDKGASVTARGIVWSTSSGPTISLTTKTSDGTGKGSFASTISGLTGNTKYYVRAYATNAAGTAYGNEVSFTTSAVVNLSLDGNWKSSTGTGITISGTTGVFYAFSPTWQDAAGKGLISMGDPKFKNISNTSAGKWNALELWNHTSNGIPVAVVWSSNGTITMSSDGKSITTTSTVTYNGRTDTGSTVYIRQ